MRSVRVERRLVCDELVDVEERRKRAGTKQTRFLRVVGIIRSTSSITSSSSSRDRGLMAEFSLRFVEELQQAVSWCVTMVLSGVRARRYLK